MDDIDDILREVDPTSDSVSEETRDLQALTRAWIAERSAPELLDWPVDGLIERINERIKTQVELIESLTGDMDPRSNFTLIVLQTELERIKYLVRSFIRARLAKIDRHALHYLSASSSSADSSANDSSLVESSANDRPRLSPAELTYATRHQALLHGHYLASFLGAFPATLQNLNDRSGNVDMIDRPDTDSAVFVRLLRDDPDLLARGTDRDIQVSAKTGDILILRWADVKGLVRDGAAELI